VTDVFIKSNEKALSAKISAARSYFRYPGSDHLSLLNVYMAWKQACVDNRTDEFIRDQCVRRSVLRAADASRKRLLPILRDAEMATSAFSKHEIPSMYGQNRRDFYGTLLRCLAAGSFLRVAKRIPKETKKYETVPLREEVELKYDGNFSSDKTSDWVIFNAYYDQPGDKVRRAIRTVTAIEPEWLFSANPTYWSDPEFMPPGHIQDGIVEVLARMTGIDAGSFRGGMPDLPSANPTTGTSS
jgi:hypothetical protein